MAVAVAAAEAVSKHATARCREINKELLYITVDALVEWNSKYVDMNNYKTPSSNDASKKIASYKLLLSVQARKQRDDYQ